MADERPLSGATEEQLQQTARFSSSVYDRSLAGEALREQLIRAQEGRLKSMTPQVERQLKIAGTSDAARIESQKFAETITEREAQRLEQEQSRIEQQQQAYESRQAQRFLEKTVPIRPTSPQLGRTTGERVFRPPTQVGPSVFEAREEKGALVVERARGLRGPTSAQTVQVSRDVGRRFLGPTPAPRAFEATSVKEQAPVFGLGLSQAFEEQLTPTTDLPQAFVKGAVLVVPRAALQATDIFAEGAKQTLVETPRLFYGALAKGDVKGAVEAQTSLPSRLIPSTIKAAEFAAAPLVAIGRGGTLGLRALAGERIPRAEQLELAETAGAFALPLVPKIREAVGKVAEEARRVTQPGPKPRVMGSPFGDGLEPGAGLRIPDVLGKVERSALKEATREATKPKTYEQLTERFERNLLGEYAKTQRELRERPQGTPTFAPPELLPPSAKVGVELAPGKIETGEIGQPTPPITAKAAESFALRQAKQQPTVALSNLRQSLEFVFKQKETASSEGVSFIKAEDFFKQQEKRARPVGFEPGKGTQGPQLVGFGPDVKPPSLPSGGRPVKTGSGQVQIQLQKTVTKQITKAAPRVQLVGFKPAAKMRARSAAIFQPVTKGKTLAVPVALSRQKSGMRTVSVLRPRVATQERFLTIQPTKTRQTFKTIAIVRPKVADREAVKPFSLGIARFKPQTTARTLQSDLTATPSRTTFRAPTALQPPSVPTRTTRVTPRPRLAPPRLRITELTFEQQRRNGEERPTTKRKGKEKERKKKPQGFGLGLTPIVDPFSEARAQFQFGKATTPKATKAVRQEFAKTVRLGGSFFKPVELRKRR